MIGSEANTGPMSAVAGNHEKVRLQCDLYGPRRAMGTDLDTTHAYAITGLSQ
jgi:hypothetical protein